MARGSLQPDERFERVRWRRLVPPEQRVPVALAAAEIGRERRRRERDLADLLCHARLGSTGDLDLPLDRLLAVPPALALAALARCLVAVGGETYPPRRDSLERLLGNLGRGGPARTLGGCRIAVRGGRLRVIPENRLRRPEKNGRGRKFRPSRRSNRLCRQLYSC
jgi:hypothetical protein